MSQENLKERNSYLEAMIEELRIQIGDTQISLADARAKFKASANYSGQIQDFANQEVATGKKLRLELADKTLEIEVLRRFIGRDAEPQADEALGVARYEASKAANKIFLGEKIPQNEPTTN